VEKRKAKSRRSSSPRGLTDALMQATQRPGEDVARPLPIDQLVIDERIQVRLEGLSEDWVDKYTIILEEGGEMEPVVVYQEGNEFILADGFHRVEAHKRAGLDTVEAYVQLGGREGAIRYAEEANLKHGYALSNLDKKNILYRRMGEGRDWFRRGDDGMPKIIISEREIAKMLGVSRQTVNNWIKAWEEDTDLRVDRSETMSADGRVRNTEKIGRKPRQKKAATDEAERVRKQVRSALNSLLKIDPDEQFEALDADSRSEVLEMLEDLAEWADAASARLAK
jgi:transposase-like protein/uncharacterized ParB-like nuclease family protein